MHIILKSLSGSPIALEVSETDSVLSLKQTIASQQGLPVEEQRLVCAGKELVDSLTLVESGVEQDSVLECLLALIGGGKKRKKKVYTKPKRVAHKRKKVKLAVLKYYSVDKKTGKVQRLRRACPNCGHGVYMAQHYNRVYCGKCYSTYIDKNAPKEPPPKAEVKAEAAPAAAAPAAKGKGKGKK